MEGINHTVLTCTLKDVMEPDGPPLNVEVRVNQMGITLHFEGYGDRLSSPGEGEPVLIENRGGVPAVVVWGDISEEDPTEVVTLDGAAEVLRAS